VHDSDGERSDRGRDGKAGASALDAARRRLQGARGPAYWRSLEELASSPAFVDLLEAEFPRQADVWEGGLDRRRFLQLAGASLALAGLGACTRQPLETIVPYVRQPEEIVPGRPLFYATATTLGGYALGVLVESHEGRPTKIEGNPDHPASLGATDSFAQASILGLYDPDRSQLLTEGGEIQTWTAFVDALSARLRAQQAIGGAGIRILTETVTSPSLASQLRALFERYPEARWHQYEPAGRDSARLGARLAFGGFLDTRYDFSRADVIVLLDSDLLASGPGSVRYAREVIDRRRVRRGHDRMSRLYAVESTPTPSGATADHRLSLQARAIPAFAGALAAESGVPGATRPPGAVDPRAARFLAAAAADLKAAGERGVVVAGDTAPPEVHALAHAINHRLGSAGIVAIHTDPVEARPVEQAASLRDLVDDMRSGRVDLLAILGGNPAFSAPADLGFVQALGRVPMRVHLALEEDETSELCHWHVPQAHELETWSDARAYDGTVTILQPLIQPLYGGKSAHELLSNFTDDPPRSGHDVVRAFWSARSGAAEARALWRRALHDGVVPGTALSPRHVSILPGAVARAAAGISWPAPAEADAIEVVFRPDPTIHDGRFANNGWLQELPKPLSKLTWDNAALLAPATAESLGIGNGDEVEISAAGRSVTAPAWILPGQPAGSVALHFGYGRRRTGRVGAGAGFDVYPLRTSDAPWSIPSARLAKTGGHRALATTQDHFSMEGRHLVRSGTLEQYRADPLFARKEEESSPKERTLYPGFTYEGHAWGLAIDLNACTGCNACVVACQAENNIPIVGKEQVLRGREMHWLRIDRYYEGSPDDPAAHHQPVMCMQCEQAPCEVVCPVGATNHSSEGLNDMVYNRCVGTRYCSNNCPYKVRRFNFLKYNDDATPVLKMLRNPDVTVRSRGVMEKCTYCVQRINGARIAASKEERAIRDGEIVTACGQACPTQAIVFGDINDPRSRVSLAKAEPTNYGLLEELNTRPRTTYLAKVRNPAPGLGEDRT
jgi:MoCo/4Fe-4S cofactor protein with predicted Tat translocation signal